ncbi:CsbD family protein [Komagataeibacter oboediens]|uniref:CsbD family protein n=3 Tax=Komagataeibacter oboediens TaxID=65958 RepID=A0ABS5SNH8_9PROT|nr:CsbD family protein [Komagataeibacter oboediens]MBT0678235.1 CsbD family protein [Komagataeibacter oboediens]
MNERSAMDRFKTMLTGRTNMLLGQLKQEIGYATGLRRLERQGIAQEMRGFSQTARLHRMTTEQPEQG